MWITGVVKLPTEQKAELATGRRGWFPDMVSKAEWTKSKFGNVFVEVLVVGEGQWNGFRRTETG